MTTKINFFGEILGHTGYHCHTRNLANATFKHPETEVRIDSPLPQQWQRWVNDNELKMLNTQYTADYNYVMIAQPQFWRFGISNVPRTFLGFCVWEGTVVPKFFIKHLADKKVDRILVPSTSVQKAIMNTEKTQEQYEAIKDKIIIIPHGVDTNIFRPMSKGLKLDDTFTFIANKGWSKGMEDRGGLQWVMKAFNEEFSDKDNVRMLAKINTSYCPPGWNLDKEIDKTGIKEENAPQLCIFTENLEYTQLLELYCKGDCFVSATMGDAFNLPVAEGMACGLMPIVTNFGGQTDFVTKENGILVDYDLVDAPDILYENAKWAKIKMDELKKAMRWAYEHQKEVAEKGKKATEEIKNNWSWTHSAEKLVKIIKEIKPSVTRG